MKLRTYLGGGSQKLVATDPTHIRGGGQYLPLFITQLFGGKRWSLAVIRVGVKRTVAPTPKPVPDETTDSERFEIIKNAVAAILPNVQNETHAWNTWNNIANSDEFRRAIVMIDAERASVDRST